MTATCGLTFDLSGLPKAGPLEGMVRALVTVKRGSTYRAVLGLFVFFEFGLVLQVELARTKADFMLSKARRTSQKHFVFALGQVHKAGTKARRLLVAEARGTWNYSRRMPEL